MKVEVNWTWDMIGLGVIWCDWRKDSVKPLGREWEISLYLGPVNIDFIKQES